MHHNILSYWRHLQNLPADHADKPTPRVCRLLLDLFERWQTQQPFPDWDCMGHIRDHPDEDDPKPVMEQPLAVRRGLAMKKMLQHLVSPWGQHHGFSRIHPDELLVGTMPPYSVGQGKEIMGYMTEDEAFASELKFLNGWSNFGHIVPNHQRVVEQGLDKIRLDCESAKEQTSDPQKRAFYQSVIYGLEGVLAYAKGFAELAAHEVTKHQTLLEGSLPRSTRELFEERIATLTTISERLSRIPAKPSKSFADAAQCIFLMNCALHWTGELTSLGRLDQILDSFYRKKEHAHAQEVLDCLWVKLDERVMLDRRHFVDRFSSADGALLGTGRASNFDQGALANQWMQQVTIGGVLATNDDKPKDACNAITEMCLHAARKFPFNCPTLDLRVHKQTPVKVLELAARALLSGGAHPILMNDDKLIPALHEKSGGEVKLASARNYVCDGCYETIFAGETEFSFIYVPG